MAWSYRQDRTDEMYSDSAGITLVKGKDLPDTPSSPEHSDAMLNPPPVVEPKKDEGVKGGVVTQYQEHPGQNVPRVILGAGETTKDKEIVKAAKEQDKTEEVARTAVLTSERSRITMEERERLRQEELEKEREKIRKEVQAEVKKKEHEVVGKK